MISKQKCILSHANKNSEDVISKKSFKSNFELNKLTEIIQLPSIVIELYLSID